MGAAAPFLETPTANSQLLTPVPVVPIIAPPSLASDPSANFSGLGPGESKTIKDDDQGAISIVPLSMQREGNEVRLCLGFANAGQERTVVDLRLFKALDQYKVPGEDPHRHRLDGRWGELQEPEEGYDLVLEPGPPNQLAFRALTFSFPESPEAVELRLADTDNRVATAWDLDLVPRLREIRIHYAGLGEDPLRGVAIPVGNAPHTAGPEVGLVVNLGDTVALQVINDTSVERDFTVRGLGIQSSPLKPFLEWEQAWRYEFEATTPGRFTFHDSLDPYQSISGTLAIYDPSDREGDCGLG